MGIFVTNRERSPGQKPTVYLPRELTKTRVAMLGSRAEHSSVLHLVRHWHDVALVSEWVVGQRWRDTADSDQAPAKQVVQTVTPESQSAAETAFHQR